MKVLQLDYPVCRADTGCPLCGHPKDKGLVMCWPCHRGFKLLNRGGTDDYAGAREALDRFEARGKVAP
jgi:hypothetical protein